MEQKAVKISELPQDIRVLAEYNRMKFAEKYSLEGYENVLQKAFTYADTPEGWDFWAMVERREWENVYRLVINE